MTTDDITTKQEKMKLFKERFDKMSDELEQIDESESASTPREEEKICILCNIDHEFIGYYRIGVFRVCGLTEKPNFIHRFFVRLILGWKWNPSS